MNSFIGLKGREIMKFKQVHILEERCRNCGLCVKICPQKAISHNGDKCIIDESKCDNCGICIEKCPVFAIKTSFSLKKLFSQLSNM